MQVVIPARNEELTIGSLVRAILGHGAKVLVVDSASQDATAAVARRSGAEVATAPRPGKGLALRIGVEMCADDVIVFCDADLTSFDPRWLDALVAPIDSDPTIALVKPVYTRPLRLHGHEPSPGEGGRVTELLARPLLHALAPELAHLAQPLAGEYAVRRGAALECAFPDGYGVEIALLLQVADLFGPGAVAEVDLNAERWHRNRPLRELSATAREVLAAALTVLEAQGRAKLPDFASVELTRPLTKPSPPAA